jgi:N-acetylglucosamine malate deacetylase 1
MKPTAKSTPELAPLLAFGAHPDDIEFGCGGVIARETQAGRRAHFVICSRGESATHGTPAARIREAGRAARLLGATAEFVKLDGDASLEPKAAHALKLAAIIRRVRPGIVFAPSLVENQHPDHPRLGRLVRDAARLARYGGVARLRARPAHAIGPLLYYAAGPEAEPRGELPVLIDISDPRAVASWTAAMRAHASQLSTRNYVELQLARARVLGLRAGVEYAQALYPNDPLVFESLVPLARAARRF